MLQKNKHLSNWASSWFHLHAYKKNDLVYIPSMKAASTYYFTLCLANGFERIKFSEIDWESDHVFGFMMEPKKRYFKGLVEDVIQAQDPKFGEQVYSILENNYKIGFVTSSHCMPITTILQDYAYQIDWIPLYEKHIPSHELFLKLCKHHGIPINDKDPTIDPHESNSYKQDIFNKFYKLADRFDDNAVSWFVNIAQDIELYYNIVAKINPYGNSWTEISWLTNNDDSIDYIEDHNWPSRGSCYCKKCQNGTKKETDTIHIGTKTWILPTEKAVLNCCPTCGTKECPQADNHEFACINQP